MSKNNYCQSTYKLIIYKIGAPNIVQSCWEWNSFVASLISFLLYLDVSVVGILHHPELQVPMIALAVGLHFFPLAKVFKRKMDYYIGLWTTAIALLAIFLMLDHEVTKSTMFAFTGIGLALATTYYGVNMIFVTRRAFAS